MPTFVRPVLTALSVAIFVCSAASGQQLSGPPRDLSLWTLTCYCEVDHGSTPHRVLKADDNGRVLYVARQGATRKQIEAEIGHPAAASQLIALVDWRLLKEKAGLYTTVIPALGPDRMLPLRKALREQVDKELPMLSPSVERLKTVLDRQGFSGSLYTLTFSYALDGLLWNQLRESHLLPETAPSKEHPFWNGLFWAVYPAQQSHPGTNTITPGTQETPALSLLWTDAVLPKINALQNAPEIEPAINKLGRGECRNLHVTDQQRHAWNFGGEDGRCLVPVVRQVAGDPVYDASKALAVQAVAILGKADITPLTQLGISAEDARVIAAHETIWAILEELEAKHVVQPPAVLSAPELSNETAPFMPLMFVTVDK
ncbi:MAG: hypothetical protein P4L03_03800 [Terracidiphilus sp.]|nr:hypothetical protein [Terracidiphilus sp.]